MRPDPSCASWASPMLSVGLAVICFSELSAPILASSVPAPSGQLLRLASMFSGNFTNEAEVREEIVNGQPTLDREDIIIYPVHVPIFDPAVTFYARGIVNGQTVRSFIAVLVEDDQGLVHYQKHHLKAPPLNIDSLQTLTPDDLEYLEGCDGTYYEIDDGIFFGEFPDCANYPPETSFANVITCNAMSILVPGDSNSPEKPSHVPYQMKPITRYPLLPYTYAGADNYKNLCM